MAASGDSAPTTGNDDPEPSARAWLRALEVGECSARELTERVLSRIEAVNPSLNAAVAIEPGLSLAAADEADRRRAAGEPGALLGLPVTIKDSLDVAGWVTTGGSFAREGERATRDATVVDRVKRAGGVVVAKTNLPECSSSGETDNAIFGRTNNPHDLERTPGGSSGGEAALLGADASVIGIGADGGCSIRLPSHYCGIAGIRATAGRVPETGVWPATRPTGMLDLTCVGPMARYVEDLELLLPVIAGADGIDPFVPPMPPPELPLELPRPLRVGFYVEDGLAAATATTAGIVRAAAESLAEPGGEATEIEPVGFEAGTPLFFGAIAADGGAHLRDAVRDAGGRHQAQFRELLESTLPAEPPPANEAFDQIRSMFEYRSRVRALVAAYDLVVCPVAPGPAPRHGEPPGDASREEPMSYDWLNFNCTYSVAGLPAAVVRAGYEDDLPVGVQIVASPFREDLALAAARAIEAELGGFRAAAMP